VIKLEAMVSFDKFSTQNRRTKKTTRPALVTTKLLAGLPNCDLIYGLSRRLMIIDFPGKSFRNLKGLVACGI
jgi:hypothetical protein